MSRVIFDAELRSKLGDLKELIQLCDENGRVLGQIVPAPPAFDESPYSLEEIDRIADETTDWYSTTEVLQHLQRQGS